MNTQLDCTWLKQLVEIDSPTGFTDSASAWVMQSLQNLGYAPSLTPKGAVRCALGENPTIGVAAHIDTLGAIVSGCNSNGTLRFSPIGGLILPVTDGEYVRIHTLSGKIYTGTILLNNPSVHVNQHVKNQERTPESMHIRLNERVSSPADVAALGIKTGDIIAIEPRYRETESGFIVSRFMDNKVSCFVLFEVARRCKQMGLSLPVELYFSNYEEVGHGGAGVFGSAIQDLLVLDMGTVGDGLAGDEYSCSICVKDSSGPYDYQTRKLLVELAEQEEIAYKLDVYPFYSSDGSAALRAGMQARVGLIGPGVAASHGIERAHKDGIEASIRLTMAYCKHIANSIK